MSATAFSGRRKKLREDIKDGAILFLGNHWSPRNYEANPYHFRQNSHLLYFSGVDLPGAALLILPNGDETLYTPKSDPDDVVWMGSGPTPSERAMMAGVQYVKDFSSLQGEITSLGSKGESVHYLPPYRADHKALISQLLGIAFDQVTQKASPSLSKAVMTLRSIKSEEEVGQIELALSITGLMYAAAKNATKPGIGESVIAGTIEGVALAYNRRQAFLPITTIRGEILHNTSYKNKLKEQDLLLIDSGAESPMGYASDITRTYPVSGRFTQQQREIYQIVLNAQLAVIDAAVPGVTNKELHFIAAGIIASGLVGLGLMKGNVDDIVQSGAHALFFPHGIGHMLGLDVHDMEDLGDMVGYTEGEERSKQFGLSFLRLAKKLEPGFVITVEPGIYFIPELIYRWKAKELFKQYIDYEAVGQYLEFGGIRIEDDILITKDRARVLGPGIPKTISEIEEGS